MTDELIESMKKGRPRQRRRELPGHPVTLAVSEEQAKLLPAPDELAIQPEDTKPAKAGKQRDFLQEAKDERTFQRSQPRSKQASKKH